MLLLHESNMNGMNKIQSNLVLRTFLVTVILVLKVLKVIKANFAKLVVGDFVLKANLVLFLTVFKLKFDCKYFSVEKREN